MIRRSVGEIVFFQFRNLARHKVVRHGITSRHAPSDRFPAGLNLSLHASDDDARVLAAREMACAALQLSIDSLVVPRQVHGSHVAAVTSSDRARGAFDRNNALPDTDALVTCDRDVALFVSAADCVPILLFDPAHGAIGVAHAGWRGTAARIASRTVHQMGETFGTRPSDLVVGIGPSIGPCCYAVGPDVTQAVDRAYGALGGLLSQTQDGGIGLDLWRTNVADLVGAGVERDKIEVAEVCTSCHKADFFSHRAENGRSGRFGAFIVVSDRATLARK